MSHLTLLWIWKIDFVCLNPWIVGLSKLVWAHLTCTDINMFHWLEKEAAENLVAATLGHSDSVVFPGLAVLPLTQEPHKFSVVLLLVVHFVHNHHEGWFSMQETLSTNKIFCLIIPTVPQGLYLGVAEFILVVVNVNGGKKLFRSLFAVNELAFWNGWGIKDLVPVVRQVARTGCKEDEENRIHCMSWNTWKLSCLKGAEYVIWNLGSGVWLNKTWWKGDTSTL